MFSSEKVDLNLVWPLFDFLWNHSLSFCCILNVKILYTELFSVVTSWIIGSSLGPKTAIFANMNPIYPSLSSVGSDKAK